MKIKFINEFESAKEIAQHAGELLLSTNERGVLSSYGKDTKAVADIEINEFILKEIEKISELPILSEESVNELNNFDGIYWIIDPIDGTLNYTRGIPLSCISIALWSKLSPIFGVIYDFNRKEIVSGYNGHGAWLNNKELSKPNPIVKNQSILATGISTYIDLDKENEGIQIFLKEIADYKKVRLIGSAALSLAYVGLNRFNAYKEKDIKLWDVAAGIAIIEALDITFQIKGTGNFCYDVYAYNHLSD
jgi:myo-inositol-1(or 4)-monophosphatase